MTVIEYVWDCVRVGDVCGRVSKKQKKTKRSIDGWVDA
jgi:hypothetical protein